VRLAEVAARAPGWSYVPLLEGILDELDGNDEGAMDHYLQAIDKGDQRPQLMYRVAQLLHAHRRDAEAQHVMRKWEARYPLDGRHARLAAEIVLGVNDFNRALELARKAVPVNARDYRDCLWLAKIEEAAGQLVDARATLSRAVERGKNIPDTWAALAQFVARTESRGQAEAVLQEARHTLSPERLPLALGRCYEAMGELDRAEQQYQVLSSAFADDTAVQQTLAGFYLQTDQPGKAEPHLRRLLDAATPAPVEQSVWARRQLALVLSARHEPEKVAESTSLIDVNLASNPASTADLRVRAFILATEAGKLREALRYLEESLKKEPLSLDEQSRLAQLYDSAGEGGKAREQYVALVAVKKPKPAHLALFTRFLARQGDFNEAERWLARLEQLDATAPATIETRAFVLAQQKTRGSGKP
jgi:tetratricopeptide (TPR) repeat protein